MPTPTRKCPHCGVRIKRENIVDHKENKCRLRPKPETNDDKWVH